MASQSKGDIEMFEHYLKWHDSIAEYTEVKQDQIIVWGTFTDDKKIPDKFMSVEYHLSPIDTKYRKIVDKEQEV